MAAYAIAERFPIEARIYAAGLKYRGISSDDGRIPRAYLADGRPVCPLGACLKYLDRAPYMTSPSGPKNYCPLPQEVAAALSVNLDAAEVERIWREALTFIDDLDDGQILDLADALGVA